MSRSVRASLVGADGKQFCSERILRFDCLEARTAGTPGDSDIESYVFGKTDFILDVPGHVGLQPDQRASIERVNRRPAAIRRDDNRYGFR